MRALSTSDGGCPAPAVAAAAGGGAAAGDRAGVSSVEVFGFVGWITSSVAYVLFMLWAFTPEAMLEAHGVTYYPSKYWAVALPAWACISIVFVYWLYESLCMMSAPRPGSPATLRDSATKRKEDVAGMASYFSSSNRSIPPLVDIPHELVSRVLHGGASPREAEERYDKGRRRPGPGEVQ